MSSAYVPSTPFAATTRGMTSVWTNVPVTAADVGNHKTKTALQMAVHLRKERGVSTAFAKPAYATQIHFVAATRGMKFVSKNAQTAVGVALLFLDHPMAVPRLKARAVKDAVVRNAPAIKTNFVATMPGIKPV